MSKERKHLSLACFIRADGVALPPFLVFSATGNKARDEWLSRVDKSVSASASESGYVDERIFGQVIDHFIAWLKAQNVPPPYLLILDGCSSHVSSVATLRKLIDAQVHALTMPTHTSSVLQPLDVGIFAPFKAFLRKAAADIRLEGTRSQFLPKADMAEVACKAWETAASPSNVVAAFRSAGAWPVNRELADKLAKNGVLARVSGDLAPKVRRAVLVADARRTASFVTFSCLKQAKRIPGHKRILSDTENEC